MDKSDDSETLFLNLNKVSTKEKKSLDWSNRSHVVVYKKITTKQKIVKSQTQIDKSLLNEHKWGCANDTHFCKMNELKCLSILFNQNRGIAPFALNCVSTNFDWDPHNSWKICCCSEKLFIHKIETELEKQIENF